MDRASTSDEDLVVDVTGFEARMDAILRGEQVGEEREEEREEGEEEWAARWDADDGELLGRREDLDAMLREDWFIPTPHWYRDLQDIDHDQLLLLNLADYSSSREEDAEGDDDPAVDIDWNQMRIVDMLPPADDYFPLNDWHDEERASFKQAQQNLEILECARKAAMSWMMIWRREGFGLPYEMALKISVEVYESGFYQDELWLECRKLTKAIERARLAGFTVSIPMD